MKYKDWINKWLNNKKYYIKESTYATYENNVYNYIIPYLGNFYLFKLNHKIIQEFILELSQRGKIRDNKGLSNKTIKDIIMLVKSSLVSAVNEHLINPFDLKFNYPKEDFKKHIITLNSFQQRRLTKYLVANINYKNLGILLSLYTGMRIGEICALKWGDINYSKEIINVNKTLQRIYLKESYSSKIVISSPKTKNANREIPLSKKLISILRHMKCSNNCYIISGTDSYIEPRCYRRYFSRVLKTNKIPHINYHVLRHTFATNCISVGTDYKTVSEILGHANINITLNLYVHPNLKEKKKCIELISKVLSNQVNNKKIQLQQKNNLNTII